ncbi:hypothetical protein RG47T_1709 [Mucilaginibacter polytrichastri]|uniref:Uncharacterized protein n=1 Tax=Mucilaginibacter polytrichastri TaxID=1302689 RepID=A0A1Q5ZWX0_9SPHI|nr:hypothetical protein RG47T_1709 [Mucilaginibacter polytrichastri]
MPAAFAGMEGEGLVKCCSCYSFLILNGLLTIKENKAVVWYNRNIYRAKRKDVSAAQDRLKGHNVLYHLTYINKIS